MGSIVDNKKITHFIRQTVVESIQGVLTDPDFGLELTPTMKKRLRQNQSRTSKTSSLEDIKRKYL